MLIALRSFMVGLASRSGIDSTQSSASSLARTAYTRRVMASAAGVTSGWREVSARRHRRAGPVSLAAIMWGSDPAGRID